MTDGLPTMGRIVVLNGAPRTGKSSIADVLVQHGWRGLGVDSVVRDVDEALRPSIGLRPGGERPDLEPHVRERYRVLFDEGGRLADSGDDVVVDVGLHADYAEPFDAWELAHEVLGSAEAWWIAVDCPLDHHSRTSPKSFVTPGTRNSSRTRPTICSHWRIPGVPGTTRKSVDSFGIPMKRYCSTSPDGRN